MALLTINGTAVPFPKRGLTETVSTNVNNGRNALGEMVGEKVGRDIYKLDNVEWVWLTKAQWQEILTLVKDFKFVAMFPDVVNGGYVSHLCYCGDRTCEPYYVNTDKNSANYGDFMFYKSCKMNIIDCGLLDESEYIS